ncbi:MAG: hypothetical protein LUD76_07370 [Alistipes sp.]|nr:hypothetical protein [Alistipes sp.]
MKKIALMVLAACYFVSVYAGSPFVNIEVPFDAGTNVTDMAATPTLNVTFYNFSEGPVNSSLVVSRGTTPISDYVYNGGFGDIPRMSYATVNDIQMDSNYTIYNVYCQIYSSTGLFTTQYNFDISDGGSNISITLEDNRVVSYRFY